MSRELTTARQTREFEAFRRKLLTQHTPVPGDTRAGWYADFTSAIEEIFPGRESQFKKPGHPATMFKARVQLAEQDRQRWEEVFAILDRYWRIKFAPGREVHTYGGFEGPRMVFEFALLDQDHYLTGSVTVDRWEDPEPPTDPERTMRRS